MGGGLEGLDRPVLETILRGSLVSGGFCRTLHGGGGLASARRVISCLSLLRVFFYDFFSHE